MVPRFKDLPAEVLAQILRYLPKPDLKSARLSSTQLSTIGASMLFDRVYFAPRKLEIERFRNIALHPVFSKSIKELVYDGRLFREENREREGYKEMIYYQRFSCQPSNGLDACLEAYLDPLILEDYSSCVDAQEHILDQKTDYHALLAGLGQMPIRRLTVQDDFGESWPRFSIHDTEYPWYAETCDLSFREFSPSSWNESRRWLPWESHLARNPTWDCRGLAHLFLAVSERCHNVDELHIGTEKSMAPMIFFHPSNGIIDHIDRLAPRLACLKLASKQYETDGREDIDVAVSRLANLLQQAKQLRTLSLSMNTDERQSRHIFHGWVARSHLSRLDLGHFRTSQDDLAASIVSQKDSLTELVIRRMELEEPGSWERLGDEMGQCLRLRKATLHDLTKDAANDIDFDLHDRGLPMDVQESVARGIMQWVSPEMLELDSYRRQGYYHLLTASVKPKGRDVL